MVALTAQLRQSASGGVPVDGGGAVSAAGGSVEVQVPLGPAAEIVVEFYNVDREAHKTRSAFPPTDNSAESKEMAKQMLIAIVNGNQAKLGEMLTLTPGCSVQREYLHRNLLVRADLSRVVFAPERISLEHLGQEAQGSYSLVALFFYL